MSTYDEFKAISPEKSENGIKEKKKKNNECGVQKVLSNVHQAVLRNANNGRNLVFSGDGSCTNWVSPDLLLGWQHVLCTSHLPTCKGC